MADTEDFPGPTATVLGMPAGVRRLAKLENEVAELMRLAEICACLADRAEQLEQRCAKLEAEQPHAYGAASMPFKLVLPPSQA